MNCTTLILECMPYGIPALGAAVAIGFLRVVGLGMGPTRKWRRS